MQTGPGFFSTMQIPILQGREIDARDREGSPGVVVISELFARTFFENQNPIGRHLTVGGSVGPIRALDLEVVGVAAEAHYGPLKIDTPPIIYVPYGQLPTRQVQQMVYALRTDGDPMRHVNTVRQIVHDADSRVPVTNVVTQAEEVDRVLNQEIVLARLCTSFAVLALLIACVGLYGTMAYTVARRTREIGIRMALGAKQGAVIWMVMREVCVLAALGLVISVPIARATSTFVESLLFQMKPNDPRVITLAVITIVAAALVAGYAPARRASRIDPTTALREE
jgi:predicted permease